MEYSNMSYIWSITDGKDNTNTWHLHSAPLLNIQASNIIYSLILSRPESKEGGKETSVNTSYDSELMTIYFQLKHVLLFFPKAHCVPTETNISKHDLFLLSFLHLYTLPIWHKKPGTPRISLWRKKNIEQ